MRQILHILIMISFFKLFGCKNQISNENKDQSVQANTNPNKTVTQTIHGEVVSFNFSDFEDLKSNEYYDRFEIGMINLPTGEVVCTDPMYRELGFPQTWRVKPGKYPVSIYIGLEEDFQGRVAYAEAIFSENKPVKWEFSLITEEHLSEFEKKMNGMYPVENGLSSFCDYSIWQNYNSKIKDYYKENPSGNFYNDILEKHFKINANIPTSSRGEDWINYDLGNGENIIMFGSGWGDGLYPKYVAYDRNNEPVKLITDFIQLQYEDNDK